MVTVRRIFWVAAVCAAAGCEPGDFAGGDSDGRPFDFLQQRVQSSQGDRWDDFETSQGRLSLRHHQVPPRHRDGDWNYRVGGTVTAGTAVYNNAYAGGTLVATCSDRLFVATTATTNNLFAFDELYQRPPGATTNCPAVARDSNCTANTAGWCPRHVWTASLSGTIDRSALTFSEDGTQVYAATSTGRLYSIAAKTATATTTWTFNAQTETGTTNATFTGVSPWVNYSDASIYIAANYTTGGVAHIRLYKLAPATGAVLYKLDIAGDGIVSSLISYDAIYFGSSTGKLYRVFDTGHAFTQAAAPWPLALWAESGTNGVLAQQFGQAIFGAPSIDTDNNLLFLAVNNVFYSINLGTNAVNSIEGGWQNATEARANDVSEYSSPAPDSALMTVFVGHGKDQSDTGTNADKGPRCHRRDYAATGVFRTDNLTSVATVNTTGTLDQPRSSPLVLHESNGTVYVFIGDPGGNLNRWTYTNDDFGTQSSFSTGHASAIESPIILDYLSGNIYFGDNSGRVYQITQATLQ